MTYRPDADTNGADAFTYRLADRGAPDGCGTPGDASAAAASTAGPVSLGIAAINDAPAFSAGEDQQAIADGLVRTLADWATGISAGPTHEAGHTLCVDVTVDDPRGARAPHCVRMRPRPVTVRR